MVRKSGNFLKEKQYAVPDEVSLVLNIVIIEEWHRCVENVDWIKTKILV